VSGPGARSEVKEASLSLSQNAVEHGLVWCLNGDKPVGALIKRKAGITMGQAGQNQNVVSLDLLSVGIVVLASALALIHFLLALSIGPPGFAFIPLIFSLNARGYVVLVTAYLFRRCFGHGV
jgi:hypothetical protein